MRKTRTALIGIALLTPAISAHSDQGSLTVQSRSLNSDLAGRAAAAAVADCDKRGYKVSAAVTGWSEATAIGSGFTDAGFVS